MFLPRQFSHIGRQTLLKAHFASGELPLYIFYYVISLTKLNALNAREKKWIIVTIRSKTLVMGTLWTAVEGPALTGLMRDSSSLVANSMAMETNDSGEGEKGAMEESTALRSLKEKG